MSAHIQRDSARETRRQMPSSKQSATVALYDAQQAPIPADSLAEPPKATRKRSLPTLLDHTSEPADVSLTFSNNSNQSPIGSRKHHDIFRNALEDTSNLSDDFMSWPMSESFADYDGSSHHSKSRTAWPVSQYDSIEQSRYNPHAEQLSKSTPDKAATFLSVASPPATKTRRSPGAKTFQTPTLGNYGSFSVDTPNINLQLGDEFSPMAGSSLEHSFCSTDDQSKPAARALQFFDTSAHGAPDKPSMIQRLQQQDSPSSSLPSSAPFSPVTDIKITTRRRPPAAPDQQYAESATPAGSIKVTLGQSSQPLFESINSKLKEKAKAPVKKARETLRPILPSHSYSGQAQYHGMAPYLSQYTHPSHPYQPILPVYQFQGHMYPAAHQYVPSGSAASFQKQAPIKKRAVKPLPQRATTASRAKAGRTAPAPLAQDMEPIALTPGKENQTGPHLKADTPPQAVTCNCKKSRCLKLYCDCFSAEQFCNGCKCDDCNNTPLHGFVRDNAIKEVLSKNKQAFKPRIEIQSHSLGCRCKKSQCLKKYCECFEARVLCTDKCRCSGCLNLAGSQQLIDKRHKMKDLGAAQFAMEVSDIKWKSQGPQHRAIMSMPTMTISSPIAHAHRHRPSLVATSREAFPLQNPYMRGTLGPYNYAPMRMQPYSTPHGRHPSLSKSGFCPPSTDPSPVSNHLMSTLNNSGGQGRRKITPSTAHHPISSSAGKRIAQTKKSTTKRSAFPLFDPSSPGQTKAVASSIFSYLGRHDVAQARLVCKQWNDVVLSGVADA